MKINYCCSLPCKHKITKKKLGRYHAGKKYMCLSNQPVLFFQHRCFTYVYFVGSAGTTGMTIIIMVRCVTVYRLPIRLPASQR